MSKEKQTLTKGEKRLLFFLYIFQPADKQLLRLVGNNYDFTGRQISSLFKKQYIEQVIIKPKYEKRETIIQLTSSGERIIRESLNLSSTFERNNKVKIKGDNNKYRQYKLSSIIEMFSYGKLFPKYIDDFVNFEHKIEFRPIDIKTEIKNRSINNNCLLTIREIRDLDEYNLRKITATRSQGVAVSQEKAYILYNHNRRKMRSHGDFEDKFHIYTELMFPNKQISAIHFGKSFKPAYDTLFKTSITQRENFIMSKSTFTDHYFVPLTENGAKQLQIYFIPDFHSKIEDNIILEIEKNRAVNLPYNGEAENGDIIYLGFECNIPEIEKVLYSMATLKKDSPIKIYCFKHQVGFYQRVFGSKATIYSLEVDEVISAIK